MTGPSATLPPFRVAILTVATLALIACGGDGGTTPPQTDDGDQIASVTLSQASGDVDIGETLQLTATVRNKRGQTVTPTVSWSSSASGVASVNGTGLVTGVSEGTAVIKATASGVSGQATIAVLDPSPPAAPSSVVAVPVSDEAVDLGWQDNSSNEDRFDVHREAVTGGGGASGGALTKIGQAPANTTTFRDTGLAPGTSYRYVVQACNENGCVPELGDAGNAGSGTVETHEELVLVTTELPGGTVGASYSQTLSATGGDGTFAWSVTEGALPDGLTLDGGTGALAGTPSAGGTFAFTLQVASGEQVAAGAFSVEIVVTPSVTTTELPHGIVGSAYSQALQAAGGDGTYAWSRTDGSLPAGLTLSAAGTISGTPTATGTSTFTAQVASAGLTATAELSIAVHAPLVITTTTLPAAVVNVAYGTTLAATGGDGAYTWSVTGGSPPAGVTVSAAGVISGTPTATGSSSFTVQVESGDGQQKSAGVSIVVNAEVQPPEVTTTSLPSGIVGTPYSQTLAATKGDGQFTWSLASGTVPAGLTLSPQGVVSGTPTAAGTSTFTVQVTSDGKTGTAELSIAVYPVLGVTTTALPGGITGQAYGQTLAAAGGDGAYAWSRSAGELPAGLSLDGSTGTIAGTPSAAGTATFTVEAASGDGQSATRDLTIQVVAPVAITTTSLPDAAVGAAYSQTLAATGGSGTYTWTVTSGTLGQLSLDGATGTISGTPTAPASLSFTVQAASGDQTATRALTLSITSGPPSITTTSLPNGQIGTAYSQTLAATGGDGTYAWALAAGSSLPAGLSLSTAGMISGTPGATGTFNFTVEVTSNGLTDDQALSISVDPAPVSIPSGYLLGASTGEAYNDAIEVSGGDGVNYAFALVDGSLPTGLGLDGGTGALTGTPSASGVFYFTIQVQSGGASLLKTYSMWVSPNPSTAFNMTIMNVAVGTTIPAASVITALAEALNKWEQVITGDLAQWSYSPAAWPVGSCDGHGPNMNGQTLDDMVVMVNLGNIDGPGGTLGSAGPCDGRIVATSINTTVGRLTLDSSDLGNLTAHQSYALVFHEIGHIVGIGTWWSVIDENIVGGTDLITGRGGLDPRYAGAGGNGIFVNEMGGGSQGAIQIPIEADGGAGTRDGHWDEGEFDTEMMTGWSEGSGKTQPLSRMTIAAIGDLAYTVDLGAADAYIMPACAPACLAAPPAAVEGATDLHLGNDIFFENPTLRRRPDGPVIRVQTRQ